MLPTFGADADATRDLVAWGSLRWKRFCSCFHLLPIRRTRVGGEAYDDVQSKQFQSGFHTLFVALGPQPTLN